VKGRQNLRLLLVPDGRPWESYIQFAVALGNVIVMLGLPVLLPHLLEKLTKAQQELAWSLSTMLIANAIIWTASGAIGLFVRDLLDNRGSDPEVRRLASEAQKLPALSYKRSSVGVSLALIYVCVIAGASIALSFLLLRQILYGSWIACALDDKVDPKTCLSLAPWFWQLPVALAISAAIYLAWNFEGLLMKAELQAIARRWTRLRTLRRPAEPSVSPQGEAQPPANLVPPLDTTGLIARAQYLLWELRRRGFGVDASEEQTFQSGRQS
jgi:hypothetical protein